MANPAALSDIELAVLTMALASDELTPTVSEVADDPDGTPIIRSDDVLADLIISSAAAWRRTPQVRAHVLRQLTLECERRPRTVPEMKAARAALAAASRGGEIRRQKT
ncbi:MAG: hypothetical protein ACI81R_002616 [Bradymonadia bacterium]|jgi:hypothetical protein